MENDNIYYERVLDLLLKEELETYPAVLVQGPKFCGKTTTTSRYCKTIINFLDRNNGSYYINATVNNIDSLLNREKPILFDEWQEAPSIFTGVRQACDELSKRGLFILTGSVSKNIKVPHSGAGRISRITMYPMSLYESKESNGTVSLSDLFYHQENVKPSLSDMTPDDIMFSACRGGWPSSLLIPNKNNQLKIARDLYEILYTEDMSSVDGVKRDPNKVRLLLKSYARNICTIASDATIINDIKQNDNTNISTKSLSRYTDGLKRLFVLEDVESWCPNIRSESNVRSSPKRNFIDPSIAVAALNVSPEYYMTHFRDFGFIFESLCIRDIKIYSSLLGGSVSYYHDKTGLEVDIVLHLKDGKYALMECKFSQKEEEKAAKNLNRLEKAILEHDADSEHNHGIIYGKPAFKAIITGSRFGHKRDDGVYVVPIGCLKY